MKTYLPDRFIVERDEDRCIQCQVCVNQCSFDTHYYDAEEDVVKSHENNCVGCHRCVRFCPTDALNIRRNPLQYRENQNWKPEAIEGIYKQAETGGVLLTGMGNDQGHRIYWDHLVLNASQVTNPSIDPLREPMELTTYLGRKPDRLDIEPETGELKTKLAPQVKLDVPIMFGAMSYGAISINVHESLARAATEMGTLWNTYAFYVLYADIDGFDPTKHTLSMCNVMDKWILSRLNTLIRDVSGYLDNYRLTEPAREMDRFVDDLSNWYVRRCRDRFWASGMEQDKVDAFLTLHTVLETLCRLAAPFVPFMTEAMYQNIVRSVDKTAPESVHLCAYPTANDALIDAELEHNMDAVLKIVVLGRSARNAAVIKNRQPIAHMYVSGVDAPGDMYTELIEGELNIKKVTFGADASDFISYNVKPQMRTLGPKYGKLLNAIRTHLAEGDGLHIVNTVRQDGVYTFDVGDETVKLLEEDMLIEPTQKEGYMVESAGEVSVILDTTLTDELIEEGFVRELISKVQTMRKEAGFEVMDHIRLAVTGNETLSGVVQRNADTIRGEVLADDIADTLAGYEKQWEINGEKATLSVEKI